jgi:hypothetical protein
MASLDYTARPSLKPLPPPKKENRRKKKGTKYDKIYKNSVAYRVK